MEPKVPLGSDPEWLGHEASMADYSAGPDRCSDLCYRGLSFIAATAPDPELYLHAIAAIFIVMAFLSATNDVAIDGYYLEALPKRDEQALLSGYRVLAYRLAMVFCRSGIVGLVNWVSGRYMHGSPYYSWMVGFGVSGIVLIGLAIAHHLALPHVGTKVVVKDNLAHARKVFKEGFKSYLAQPKIGIILLFITLYKLGDEILFSMVTPLYVKGAKDLSRTVRLDRGHRWGAGYYRRSDAWGLVD